MEDTIAVLIALVIFFVSLAAWVTHVIICLQQGLWGFLIAGAIAFPVGVIHGFGRWFGWW